MNEYDLIKELLSRHHSGQADLSDEDAELLAMKAQRFGERFTPESKPFSKGAFDAADMATFGLLPDEWRPYSPGQDIFGETTADKFAGTIGSICGMIGGAAAATKGAKMGWNAIKKTFAKKKADDIAANVYKGNLLGPGPTVPQLGQGSPLPLPPGRPGVPQLPGGGRYPVQTTPNVGDIGRQLEEQRRRLDEAIAAIRANPLPPYQKGGYVESR